MQRTAAAGAEYLRWFLPGLALQFALVAMGSALRGTGINKPTLLVQMLTVVLNAILAPILIAGWLHAHAARHRRRRSRDVDLDRASA